jgi:hypothetical protein
MLPASPGRALTASARLATLEVSAKVVDAVAQAPGETASEATAHPHAANRRIG